MDREEFFIQLILATSRGEKKILYGYPPILTAGGRVYDFCEYYGRFGEDSCNKWEGCKIENDKCVFADPYYWTYNAGNDQLVYIEPGTRTTITLDAISKNNPPLTSSPITLPTRGSIFWSWTTFVRPFPPGRFPPEMFIL